MDHGLIATRLHEWLAGGHPSACAYSPTQVSVIAGACSPTQMPWALAALLTQASLRALMAPFALVLPWTSQVLSHTQMRLPLPQNYPLFPLSPCSGPPTRKGWGTLMCAIWYFLIYTTFYWSCCHLLLIMKIITFSTGTVQSKEESNGGFGHLWLWNFWGIFFTPN